MKRKAIPILILCLFMMGACATTPKPTEPPSYLKVSYQTLATFNQIYDFSMKSLASLYKQKLITDADKDKAIKYGNDFYRAYQLSVDALLAYMQVKDAPNQAKAEIAMNEAMKVYSTFLTFVQPLILKEVK